MISNYHLHTHYCDGKDSPEDYLSRARTLKTRYLGFSSHAPLPFYSPWTMSLDDFRRYRDDINALKANTPDIQIFCGLELDYIPQTWEYTMQLVSDYPVDFTIGSVHVLGNPYDNTYLLITGSSSLFEERLKRSGFSARHAVECYFKRMKDLLVDARFDIVAHFDIIKKVNVDYRIFSTEESWYTDLIDEAISLLPSSGKIVEINSGSLSRKKSDELFPSDYIIRQLCANHVPVVINTDAHQVNDIDGFYTYAVERLRSLGYRHQTILTRDGWSEIPLLQK